MLELKNLGYQVKEAEGNFDILHEINLSVEDNQFVVITGPNGGGKTTLAKVIMGLVTPTQGSVLYNGTDITNLSITERAQLGISYAFQQPPRFKGLKVRDLLELSAGNKRLSLDECCQCLTRVGLCAGDYIDRKSTRAFPAEK
jgi:Fe-S cluster assembly ATP-binding protein